MKVRREECTPILLTAITVKVSSQRLPKCRCHSALSLRRSLISPVTIVDRGRSHKAVFGEPQNVANATIDSSRSFVHEIATGSRALRRRVTTLSCRQDCPTAQVIERL